ncbi:doublecortin domain-containing protein 1-like isoform X1 [Chiloscyllium plagiosum]|uniref:doublecortin domain-containing protein 1-like isoform X1 n=1 Tax=Chiloscyllium plagiosum TaxID=36176 RepID=UPI001CB83ED9|nr:doublecortin domain-containing protein 1-like isoform X1 [Chiloscyllium plagiosum]
MGKNQRPKSASTSSSKTSATTARGSVPYTDSLRSQCSSLEDALVQEYIKEISKFPSSSQRLPRKCRSPYKMTIHIRTQRAKPPLRSPVGSLPCSQTRRSRFQSSIESCGVVSDCESSNSIHKKKSSLRFPRIKRCLSAPPGSVRKAHSSLSSRLLSGHRNSKEKPLFKRQQWIIKVTAYKNGTSDVSAKITASSIKLLLEACTTRLDLNTAARRVFLANGREAFEPRDIPHNADVYISTGEPFMDPSKKIKDHMLLTKRVSWTMKGVVLPVDKKRGKTKPVLSKRLKKLTENTSVRILVFKNGAGQDGYEITTSLEEKQQFLDQCTQKIKLAPPAKRLYDWHGDRIRDLRTVPLLDKCLQNSNTPLRGPVWVSKGEGFIPSGARTYIQGILWAVNQKLTPARNYSKQIYHTLNGCTRKVTHKALLSMTTGELYKINEDLENLIDELRAVIKKYNSQLSKLGPQLQAEEEWQSALVSRTMNRFPANTTLPKGLQLKVYRNGQSTGEVLIYINMKAIEKESGNDKFMMERLLQMICQRLQCSSGYHASGLNLSPTRLFDENGQEIKNPLFLENDQKVWVSYGEDYRSICKPFLCVRFDRVIGVIEQDQKVVYKTSLEYNGPLTGMEKCETWEVCTEFPDNYDWARSYQSGYEKMDMTRNYHFLQWKNDPQLVVYPSITIENRSEKAASIKKEQKRNKISEGASKWTFSYIWVIAKAGMIICRAVPQLCLAVSDQPIRLKSVGNVEFEGYTLVVQKRMRQCPEQQWGFSTAGHIYSMAHPEMVLTYIGELKLSVDAIQTRQHFESCSLNDQGRNSNLEEEVSANSLRKGNHKEVCRDSEVQLLPEGCLEAVKQLTAVLLTKLEEKHPWTTAQRWAIKHEGTAKPGQWKHSKLENPLWNKLTYMWPVLPDGELNEEYDWPIEGSLLPNAPPLLKPSQRNHAGYTPVRIKVLKNGERDKSRILTVTGPDITNMLKKTYNAARTKIRWRGRSELQRSKDRQADPSIKVHELEFKQFLERCTLMLGLPFAARRLFDETGKEHTLLKDLQRDQLVYVSCGEAWIDPNLTSLEQRKRLQLNKLTCDIALIRSYSAMRNPEGLVLEVVGTLMSGAKLALAESVVPINHGETTSEADKQNQPCTATTDEDHNENRNFLTDLLDAHTRTHLTVDARYPKEHYPWERKSKAFDDDGVSWQEDGKSFTNIDLYNKYRSHPKPLKPQRIHQQQFQFQDGHIIICSCPWLVVGVLEMNAQPGAEVTLMEKKADDIFQRWIWREDNRTFHLMGNPDLVLAVSMTQKNSGYGKSVMEVQGCSIILQKYKGYNYGAANQKWFWMPEIKVLNAFYTSVLDKEITAANQASVCTFCICKTEELDQPGYYITHACTKQKTMVCLACSRALRGQNIMTKLNPGNSFICATGRELSQIEETGPFKCIRVTKTDLSTSEVENTLAYWEEKWISLRKETSVQTIPREISAAKTQLAVRVMAYRNGAGYEDGQLIIGTTFSSLLATCTQRLALTRPACRLYTADGILILTLPELIAWAVNETLQEHKSKTKQNDEDEGGRPRELGSEEIKEDWAEPSTHGTDHLVQRLPRITTEDLESIDTELISLIVRNPIDVWVSCGESFVPLSESNRRLKLQRKQWLQKQKVLLDLDKMKHKMRHIQGRRVGAMGPASMVPTKSSIQPVAVAGGWTEPSPEEVKLLEDVQSMEMHLSEVHAMLKKEYPSFHSKLVSSQRPLYSQPDVKRVLAYLNGDFPDQGTYVFGKTIQELLENCTARLKLRCTAKTLFSPDGEQITSWERIERDMLVCVSLGEPFMTSTASRQRVEIRANYAKVLKEQGQDATNIVITSRMMSKAQGEAPSPFLAILPAREINE